MALETPTPNTRTLDDQFRNSSAPTKTGTEQAFNASFATMWGNVSLSQNQMAQLREMGEKKQLTLAGDHHFEGEVVL